MAINEKILTIDELRQGLEGEITLISSVETNRTIVAEEASSDSELTIPVAKIINMLGVTGDEPRPLRTSSPEGDVFVNLAQVRKKNAEAYKQRLNLALRAIGEAEAA